ncbi:MAG: hypothetical protein A7316_10700 [Candidatus Altiarchaeales archaeon WOR_SM1_86-2]|nr:MAG: hypothetical protein A7316_10700 [Candidatus Altiarchaeales archaeon WOR_SM1_86-2]
MPKVKKILKTIKKLEIKTNKLVEGLISGEYHSVFKGMGIEFSEVREYSPGDDIRTIDWNVTARYNSPFVKEFIEERDLNVYIIFDVSASNEFGFERSKKETGFEIAASIMFSALRNNDNVGLCLFTDKIEKFIKPRKGKKHVLRVLREMVYHEPKNRLTDICKTLTTLNNIIKRKSILFIISDFITVKSFEKPLKFLKTRHDVILINLTDIRETEIPDVGYIYLEDEETKEQVLVDTSDKNFREFYFNEINKLNNKMTSSMKKLNVDMIQVNTDKPFYVPMRNFFKIRERRKR